MVRHDRELEPITPAQSVFITLQLMWFLAGGMLVWILRDGLGPEAVTTTGPPPLVRMFQTFYWGPVCLALLIVDVSWWRRRRLRRD